MEPCNEDFQRPGFRLTGGSKHQASNLRDNSTLHDLRDISSSFTIHK
jgi:hypothetical protein